jgi:hypothetical protein
VRAVIGPARQGDQSHHKRVDCFSHLIRRFILRSFDKLNGTSAQAHIICVAAQIIDVVGAGSRLEAQASIIRRAMLMGGGTVGSSSGTNHAASTISEPSTRNSPARHAAVKPIMSECGNGQGWLAK